MRIGLGCMRLSTEPERDDDRAQATLRAALDIGIELFDTARSYGHDEGDLGHNERLIARAWRAHAARTTAPALALRVITKCGMRRDDGQWIPDGRAKRIRDDLVGSVEALGGLPIDTALLHAPDGRVDPATSLRALARAQAEGLVREIGVSNVNRTQLDAAIAVAPVSMVQLALGAYDDAAIRGGVVEYCLARGIAIVAHTILGGPERARKLARDDMLARIAARYEDAQPLEVFVAYLAAVSPLITPLVGARRPETVARIARAAKLELSPDDLAALDERFHMLGHVRRPRTDAVPPSEGDVVVMIGVPGAGKSRAARALVMEGYERLNRDSVGGTLRGIADALAERLRAGGRRFVLDNTYAARATRNDIVRIAREHGVPVRAVFFDTPPHEARVNIVLRMLERFGRVLDPAEIGRIARTDSAALAPNALTRVSRELEPPALDEGFVTIDRVAFARVPGPQGRSGLLLPLEGANGEPLVEYVARWLTADIPCLLFGWMPAAEPHAVDALHREVKRAASALGRTLELAVCTHPAGPPVCWCRPPLPGLFLAFAHRHGVDLRASRLLGTKPSHGTLARELGVTITAS